MSNSLRNQGLNYLWVEHGTANPNARGFWNKYFITYCYTMIRYMDKKSKIFFDMLKNLIEKNSLGQGRLK